MRDVAAFGRRPGERGDATFEAQPHQFVIAGVEVHLVDAPAEAVEGFEFGRVAVGFEAPSDGFSRTYPRAECVQVGRMCFGAFALHRILQRPIGGEQIHIFERRGLVRDLMRREG